MLQKLHSISPQNISLTKHQGYNYLELPLYINDKNSIDTDHLDLFKILQGNLSKLLIITILLLMDITNDLVWNFNP